MPPPRTKPVRLLPFYRGLEARTEAEVRQYVIALGRYARYRFGQQLAKAAYVGATVLLLWSFALAAPLISAPNPPPFERVVATGSALVLCVLWLISQRAFLRRRTSVLADQRALLHSETQNAFAFYRHHSELQDVGHVASPALLNDDRDARHFVRKGLEDAVAPINAGLLAINDMLSVLACVVASILFLVVAIEQITLVGLQPQWLVLLPTVALVLYIGGRIAAATENRALHDIDQKFREVLSAWTEYRLRKLLQERYHGLAYTCKRDDCAQGWGGPPFRYAGVCRTCFAEDLAGRRLRYLRSALVLVVLAAAARFLTWSGQPSWVTAAIGLLLFLSFSSGLWQDFRRWYFLSEEDHLDAFIDREPRQTSAA
jgi:hypothetical protein